MAKYVGGSNEYQYQYLIDLLNNKQCLIVPIGIPGSGRSIIIENIKNMIDKEKLHVVVADDVRKQLFGSRDIQGNPAEVFRKTYDLCRKPFKEGKSVIVDATNIENKNRLRLVDKAIPFGYEKKICKVAIDVSVSLEIALFRYKNAGGKVPERKIVTMYNRKTVPGVDDTTFDYVFTINNFDVTSVKELEPYIKQERQW